MSKHSEEITGAVAVRGTARRTTPQESRVLDEHLAKCAPNGPCQGHRLADDENAVEG